MSKKCIKYLLRLRYKTFHYIQGFNNINAWKFPRMSSIIMHESLQQYFVSNHVIFPCTLHHKKCYGIILKKIFWIIFCHSRYLLWTGKRIINARLCIWFAGALFELPFLEKKNFHIKAISNHFFLFFFLPISYYNKCVIIVPNVFSE